MTSASSMLAIIRTVPLHCSQVSMSTRNTRFSRRAFGLAACDPGSRQININVKILGIEKKKSINHRPNEASTDLGLALAESPDHLKTKDKQYNHVR